MDNSYTAAKEATKVLAYRVHASARPVSTAAAALEPAAAQEPWMEIASRAQPAMIPQDNTTPDAVERTAESAPTAHAIIATTAVTALVVLEPMQELVLLAVDAPMENTESAAKEQALESAQVVMAGPHLASITALRAQALTPENCAIA